MYKIEIRKSEEYLLKHEFQHADFPLFNIQIRNHELKVKLQSAIGEISHAEKIPHNKSALDISISAESLLQMMNGTLIRQDFFCNLHIEQLSSPMRMIIYDIVHSSCHPKFKRLYLETKICELLICILSADTSTNHDFRFSSQEKGVFKRLKAVISGNLSSHYSIDELAQIAGMNRTKVQNGFKAIFGKTIHTYTLDLRMLKAKSILVKDPNANLKEVASAVGYRYTNHFSTAFKKKFNFSPSLFKKGIQSPGTLILVMTNQLIGLYYSLL